MKHQLFYIAGATFSLFTLASCNSGSSSKSKPKSVVINFKKEGTLSLMRASDDSVIQTLDIEIADDDYQIQTGLMYRDSMKEKQGMLFIFPDMQLRNFYMKNTRIPLDIIYIDADYKIVSFQRHAKPYDETSLPSEAPAKYVLEVNAGLVEEWQLNKGDKIEFELLQ
ncbi:MAG: DUF192 domain-containing protein [Bacteroidota bacterium]